MSLEKLTRDIEQAVEDFILENSELIKKSDKLKIDVEFKLDVIPVVIVRIIWKEKINAS